MRKHQHKRPCRATAELASAALLAVFFTIALAAHATRAEELNVSVGTMSVAPADIHEARPQITASQLHALREDPAACSAALQLSEMTMTPIADRRERGYCGFTNAVTLEQSRFSYSGPVRVSCPMASAIDVWEREAVAIAAAEHLSSAVVEIEHMGSYNCRTVAGRRQRPSEHASANALDVSGFVLADGRRISVREDFNQPTPEGAFLRALRDRSCGIFAAVLSPDYNSAHADHLHLDMGRYRVCR